MLDNKDLEAFTSDTPNPDFESNDHEVGNNVEGNLNDLTRWSGRGSAHCAGLVGLRALRPRLLRQIRFCTDEPSVLPPGSFPEENECERTKETTEIDTANLTLPPDIDLDSKESSAEGRVDKDVGNILEGGISPAELCGMGKEAAPEHETKPADENPTAEDRETYSASEDSFDSESETRHVEADDIMMEKKEQAVGEESSDLASTIRRIAQDAVIEELATARDSLASTIQSKVMAQVKPRITALEKELDRAEDAILRLEQLQCEDKDMLVARIDGDWEVVSAEED